MENKKHDEQSDNKKKSKRAYIFIGLYTAFIILSHIFSWNPGIQMGDSFKFFALDMLKILPAAFILVGLFMVWVDRKTIEKYFGEASGIMGHLAAILLACTTLYPFIVVIPMAAALMKKGARLGIVITFLGATAICRIPMSIFESTFLGIKFTIIRYIVALPLIVISSYAIERIAGKDYFKNVENI
jgi:uncharacterized membrane protein YraQ (UPF0718 family)